MSDDDELPNDAVREALEKATDEMLPADDPNELEPDYPADYTPEDRVDHVLYNEYPRWRSIEWIAAAADTSSDVCKSVIWERLAEGEVEVCDDGVRRNRYHVYFEEVESLTEKARDRPRWIQ